MEKIEQYKQTSKQFILNEFIIFLSQIVIFFMVTIFVSNFLSNEDKLVNFLNQKINDGTKSELFLSLLAILFVIGLFTTLDKIFDNKQINLYIDEVLYEIPKLIYTLGSSVSGAMLASTLYLIFNPTPEITAIKTAGSAVSFAFIVFVYGCFFSYMFKRKTHIINTQT
ncbi:hypothetical protein L4D04_22215 [Photobacterium angustum]|uniref:Putative membrane protein n=1 Tax=Photobacterium leiognathi lrivu.4.1 TaxID=1248232 RepID=V5F7L8_PHOLE|nr:hypothetical protein [Photobacterium leiognathi]GAD31294.1 putative membrane protein [Photobacterium leiognathi lrivu.4.1]